MYHIQYTRGSLLPGMFYQRNILVALVWADWLSQGGCSVVVFTYNSDMSKNVIFDNAGLPSSH